MAGPFIRNLAAFTEAFGVENAPFVVFFSKIGWESDNDRDEFITRLTGKRPGQGRVQQVYDNDYVSSLPLWERRGYEWERDFPEDPLGPRTRSTPVPEPTPNPSPGPAPGQPAPAPPPAPRPDMASDEALAEARRRRPRQRPVPMPDAKWRPGYGYVDGPTTRRA